MFGFLFVLVGISWEKQPGLKMKGREGNAGLGEKSKGKSKTISREEEEARTGNFRISWSRKGEFIDR